MSVEVEKYVVHSDFYYTEQEWVESGLNSKYDDVSCITVNVNHPDYPVQTGTEKELEKLENDLLNKWSKGVSASYFI